MIRRQHRYLVQAKKDCVEKMQWIESLQDLEFYKLGPNLYGINEYSIGRLETYLNQNGDHFAIIPITNASNFKKIFANDPDGLTNYERFVYLTGPIPKGDISTDERNKVVDQLLEKILYFTIKAEALTLEELHFLRMIK